MIKNYIFDTILVDINKIYNLEKHLNRLYNSVQENWGFKIDLVDLKEQVIIFLNKQIFKKGKKYRFNIFVFFDGGIKFKIAEFNESINSKLVFYSDSVRESNETYYKDKKYHELFNELKDKIPDHCIDIILKNEKDEICECLKSNIFFYNKNTIYVPNINCGYFFGITLKEFLNKSNKKIIFKNIKYFEIKNFSNCFICNSLIGIREIDEIINNKNNTLWKKIKNKINTE